MCQRTMIALWQQQTTRANQCYARERYREALSLYRQAITQALSAFDESCCADDQGALAAVLVSYFNLGDGYLATGNAEQAGRQFELAEQFLGQLAMAEGCNSELVYCGRSQLFREWTRFIHSGSGQLSEHHLRCYENATNPQRNAAWRQQYLH